MGEDFKKIILVMLFTSLILFFFDFEGKSRRIFPWSEEKCDSIGIVLPTGTIKHSIFHYELTRLLAYESGFSATDAETIARYCALTDQINPKNNYPYPLAINSGSIPDTFPAWSESIAGTERANPHLNGFGENAGVYWHFALRDSCDTITGCYVYGSRYPRAANISYRNAPYFWRVPFSYTMSPIRDWALYGMGSDGLPDNSTPDTVYYYNSAVSRYQPVPK